MVREGMCGRRKRGIAAVSEMCSGVCGEGMKRIVKIVAAFLACTAAFGLPAGDLVFNGNFQLGEAGYMQKRILRRDRNPKLEYHPLSVRNGIMRIHNPCAERFELHTREFFLKPDTEYVFRFTARGTSPGQKLYGVLYNVSGRKWNACHVQAVLQKEFQTYENVYRTPPESNGSFHIHFRNVSDYDIPASDIEFKDIAVFEKGGGDDRGIQVALEAAEPLFIKTGSTCSVPLTVKIGNFSARPLEAKGKLALLDDTGETVFSTWEIDAGTLRPGEVRSLQTTCTVSRFGTFLVRPEIRGATHSLDAAFAVIGKYTPRPLDPGRDFCVAINDGLGVSWYPQVAYQGYMAWNAHPEKRIEMLAQAGVRLFRDHDAEYEVTSWYLLEPEKGKWDFSEADYRMAVYEKHQIELLSCLGRINFLEPTEREARYMTRHWPDWLAPHCRRVTDYPDYTWKDVRGRITLPPVDEWRNYICQVVEHFKGRIRYYEIFNEPNGVMGAADYLIYCRSAYEEVKQADPAARVIGLCVTTDMGSTTDQFVSDFLKQGGGKAMDIASFHPYQGRELSSLTPADRYIENFRNLLRKSGRDFPVWNTELYYLYDVVSREQSQSLSRPGHVAARFLTDLGEGVGQSIAVHGDQLWSNPHLLPVLAENNLSEATGILIPSPNFVAYNALARYFEAAEPKAKYELPNGGIAYCYIRRDGSPIAAVWNAKKRENVKVDLSEFEVLDVLGNPLSDTGTLAFSGTPYYLLPRKQSGRNFQEAVRSIRPELEENISCGGAVRKAGSRLFFTLFNHGRAPEAVTVGFRGAGFTAKRTVFLTVPAGGTVNAELELKPSQHTKQTPQLRYYAAGRLVEKPVRLHEVPAVLNAGETLQREFVVCRPKVEGGQLRIGFDVLDGTDSGAEEAGRSAWEQDCIELFFDLAPRHFPERFSETYGSATFRLFYLPRVPGAKRLTGWFPPDCPLQLSDVRVEEKKTAGGYSVSFLLPLAKLPKDGLIGFDFKVDDALPGKRAERSVAWTCFDDRHGNRCRFGLLDCMEEK